MRRAARTLLGLVLASGLVGLSFACASILDIKDLSVAELDSAPRPIETSVPDASDACAPRGATLCQKLCPVPDFCDDFEGSKLAEGWDPPFGAQNPLRTGEGEVYVATDDAGNQTRVMIAEARSVGTESGTSIIATRFDKATRGRTLRGARITAELHATDLSFLADASPPGDPPGLLTMLVFGSYALNQGVAISLYEAPLGELRLGLMQRTLGSGRDKFDLATLVVAPRTVFFKNPLPVELIVGRPELLREQRAACSLTADAGEDAGGEDDVRVLLRLGATSAVGARCAALRGDLAAPAWLSSTALFVGAAVSDFGTASVRIDNVTVTLFE